MKKSGIWLFVLMIIVMSILRNLDVNIFEIPLLVIIVLAIAFISLLITVLIKYKHLHNKYFRLLMLILIMMTLTLSIFIVIEKANPKLLDNFRIFIALFMVVELISIIVVGVLAEEKKNN
jgi:hypothetical protein